MKKLLLILCLIGMAKISNATVTITGKAHVKQGDGSSGNTVVTCRGKGTCAVIGSITAGDGTTSYLATVYYPTGAETFKASKYYISSAGIIDNEIQQVVVFENVVQ
jgi:hypothetical protein